MTLQRRMLGYLALAAIASCALTVAVGVVLVRHRIATQRLAALENQADLLAAFGGVPGALGAGEHVYGVGTGRVRRLRPLRAAAVLAAVPAAGDTQGAIDVVGHELLYVARSTLAGRIVLVDSASLAFAQWRPFLTSLVLAGLGGAVLAAVLSYLLAGRLTRPLAELSAATARLASGEPGVEVPVRGRDELAGLAAAFNEMSSELGRARAAQQGFLESVGHELKTPLTSIRGYAEAVHDGAVTPADGSTVITAEADRLQRMVQDLLELGRLGRAGFSVAREPVDLAAVATRAVERHLPRARALSVELSSYGSDGAWGLGDADRLLQATSNLIENALRMTPAGGSVTARAKPGRITVTDDGPGLAPEDLPRAFERFYLHDRQRSERVVGSGLGLAIVKELVVAMGGSVEAANAPDGGAVFALRLLSASTPGSHARADALRHPG
ncbi:MAG: sensor histidine kinase [Solirubrobacteraceae bacterium]